MTDKEPVTSLPKDSTLDIQLLKTIMDLEPEFRYFIWLYLPLSVIDVDEVIGIHKKNNLPDYILLRKLIVYCVYNSMDLDTTIDFLFKKNLIKKDVEDLLIVEEAFNTPINFNELNRDIFNQILKCAIQFYKKGEEKPVEHNKYPMVDIENGRARLGWLKCYHHGCKFKGFDADYLRLHLESCKAYVAYFHKSHENMVAHIGLTPEKVKAEGIRKCPSAICDKTNVEMTPDELVYHFKRLGIPPFWNPGDIIDYDKEAENDKNDVPFNVINDKPIYSSDECVVCIEKHPSVLFLDCNHHVVCIGCYKGLKDCPVCGNSIKRPICY